MERDFSITTVDQYIKAQPPLRARSLTRLRRAIRAAAPEAEERIGYGIPMYKQNGPLVCFVAQKNYLSFIVTDASLLKKFAKELAGFEISGTTIHFTPEHELPLPLITKIVLARVKMRKAKPAVMGHGRKRPTYPMPRFMKEALTAKKLTDRYNERPHYQRNDYIAWITRAKRDETVTKRLDQMLTELKGGTTYMGMSYRPVAKKITNIKKN